MSGGSGSGDIPTGYDESAYFTISSTTDADTFSSRFHHSTDSSIPSYYDSTTGTTLALGNRININDGTYNTQWMIAGFDVEYNRTASDGITYNNGYGIALIPVNYVSTGVWDMSTLNSFTYKKDNKTYALNYYGWTPYSNSDIDTFCNNTMITALQTVLGDHIVNRNVLLANSVYSYTDSSPFYKGDSTVWANRKPYSTGYIWTTRYGSLLSTMQLTGQDSSSIEGTGGNTKFEDMAYGGTDYSASPYDYYGNKYDQGEANYKLPIFDNISVGIDTYGYCTRAHIGLWLKYDLSSKETTYSATTGSAISCISDSGELAWCRSNATAAYRPMIYVR